MSFSEWGVNIQRDSYASYIGHYPILAYFSVAENESIGRQRYNFMQVRLDPASSSIIYINKLCMRVELRSSVMDLKFAGYRW
ncbi:hypothetical protein ZIOFF_071146 [Zingiber officinale]|uniref:Uncharacterized protein n=1 Tax=Zingiber officinale TaxID=94328 RepID=A0A8J5C9B3_ZINOF|nr:hypothetical protein ZIOFF_071146 [Zingiber officinale]